MKVLIQLLRAVLTLIWALVLVVGVRLYLDCGREPSAPADGPRAVERHGQPDGACL